ncbi:MAG: hypothetical protein ACTHVK_09485 [Brachybacterium sp.]|uniref:WXG100 family type VII secretion target n=1 Tax=unclassified Brachybacterium TaxID=2623841 RepID=UPI003F906C6C
MSGFYGADTDQLRRHSELLRSRARSLGELRERLHPAVADESIWQGGDADAFRTRWTSQTAPLFDDLVGQLTRQAGDTERHADEQDEASGPEGSEAGAGGGGSAGGGGGGGGDTSEDGKSLWEQLTDGGKVWNAFQGLWNSGKKILDLTGDVRDFTRFLGSADDLFEFVAGSWMYDKAIYKNIFNVGSEFSGLADEVAKAIGIPTGIANTKFFGWADDAAKWAGEAVPFLGKAAPFLGKALPVADVFFGGAQMIEGIQSGDTFSAITGGAGALGGGLMIAGGALSATGIGAVVGGPIAAAGAIISGGAALADVGKMVYDNWDSISATAADAWNATTDFVSDTAGAVADTAGDVVDAVSDGFSDAVDGLADALPW